MSQTRRLAAILAADVAGYSRLMGVDDEGTLERLKALRRELLDPKIAEHHGRLVKTTGDGLLAQFGSVVDALRCAVEVQREMAGRNTGVPPGNRIELRIGINVGDIVVEDGDIFGDGVNVAARLEALAEPGGICVAARVQEDAAGKLDLAFEDTGEQALKNIARPVRVFRVRDTAAESPSAQAQPALPLPDKPSIAVLPFANMSRDPEQEYFADGMVEEIITALSRIRWLFVIARNSSFTYKGQAVDVKQVGRELGVRYVLEGSVRKAGGRVRITAQLIDAVTGTHLWADRFDGSLEDVFELQDRVAISVAGVIEPTLQAETRRSADRPTADLTAHDLYLRAIARFLPLTQEGLRETLGLLEQAIGRDPNFGPALAWTAICQLRLYLDGWSDQPEAAIQKGRELARRALETAASDPETVANAVFPLAYFGENLTAMMALIDNALALNPSFARGWFCSAHVRLLARDLEIAVEHSENSLRLSPRIRMGGHYQVIGMAYFFMRRFEEAIAKLLVSVQEYPGGPVPLRFLTVAYAHIGRFDEARDGIHRLRGLTPIVIHPATYIRSTVSCCCRACAWQPVKRCDRCTFEAKAMRYLVLGAGAIGGYFGGMLLRGGADVSFMVRPKRAAQLAERGLIVKTPDGDIKCSAKAMLPGEVDGHYDVVLLACKAYDLDSAMDAIAPAVGDDSVVLPLQNGINHINSLMDRFGQRRVLGGKTLANCWLSPEGDVTRRAGNPDQTSFGELTGERSARCEAVQRALAAGGAASAVSENIISELWAKCCAFAAVATIAALTRATGGEIAATPSGAAFVASVLDECERVSAAERYPTPKDVKERVSRNYAVLGSPYRPSILDDLEAGRRTEGEHTIGDFVRRADRHGLAVPILRAALCNVQVHEGRVQIGRSIG